MSSLLVIPRVACALRPSERYPRVVQLVAYYHVDVPGSLGEWRVPTLADVRVRRFQWRATARAGWICDLSLYDVAEEYPVTSYARADRYARQAAVVMPRGGVLLVAADD